MVPRVKLADYIRIIILPTCFFLAVVGISFLFINLGNPLLAIVFVIVVLYVLPMVLRYLNRNPNVILMVLRKKDRGSPRK